MIVPPDAAWRLARRFEGCRLAPYLCPAGIPTIGWGHTPWTMDGQSITQELADELLEADLEKACMSVLRQCPGVTGDRLAALTDFVFNLGAGRLQASTLRRRVNAGDWAGARLELGKWVFASGRKLPGLVLRRAAEAALL